MSRPTRSTDPRMGSSPAGGRLSVRSAKSVSAFVVLMCLLQGASCRKSSTPEGVPTPSSSSYKPAVRSFFVGLAALQAGDNARALKELTEATRLAPDEPAALADLAILEIRGQRVDDALKHLQHARELAPNSGQVIYLHALAKTQKGDFVGAAADYKRAAELDPNNLRARYALVDQVLQTGGPGADAEAQRLLQEIAKIRPDNLVVQLELARLAAKRGDTEVLKSVSEYLSGSSATWPARAKEQLAAFRAAVRSGNAKAAASPLLFVKNLLLPLAKYRTDVAMVKPPPGELGEPIAQLLKLTNPPQSIATPDEGLAFGAEAQPGSAAAGYVTGVYLTQEAKPSLVTLGDAGAIVLGGKSPLPFSGGAAKVTLGGHPVAAVDLNADFKMDLAFASSSGLKLYQQSADGSFVDVTAKSKIPSNLTAGNLRGVWAADIDLDGDMDLIVAPASGTAVVLQNNADGTFKPLQLFSGASGIVDFAWADLDNDGDPDAVLLDSAGGIHVFLNDRAGQFHPATLPADVSGVAAFTIIDANDDGQFDIVALRQDGGLVQLMRDLASGVQENWKSSEIGRWEGSKGLKAGAANLFSADLDNNGGVDLIASNRTESRVWLHGPNAAFKAIPTPIPAIATSAVDMNGDGRVDLVGIGADGKPVVMTNQGKKSYAWQDIRPKATTTNGDQRINSFGIGGSMEIRAGFLTQRQLIDAPAVHFGMGENSALDAARIFWPNGQMQAEFTFRPNQSFTAVQRLKGSCPWMFAWNGSRMAFVTDTLWRSPLGLRINAQDTGRVAMTEDWVRIPGSALVPRDGAYDIRITAELWETHFFDHVSLLSVDHPAGTEAWVDERFAIPPPKNGIILTKPSTPVERAVDDHGTDVTGAVRDLDGKYLDTFGRGLYQGVTRDHFVEVDLGAGTPDSGPLYLIGQGWIHPTDSSINVAMAQGEHPAPHDLSLEVPDGKGAWKVARPHLGFPAGKNKSIVIDLSGLFRPGQSKRLRLRTNLEIYWDRISWAVGADAASQRSVKLRRTLADTAELRFRGYSATHTADASSPELPDYEDLAGTAPRWCDLVGYYTRYGDVRELLRAVDDRYVIMNAGDEMAFRFPVQPAPANGWTRDFVLISDGWEKDGDFNTGFSKTVLPLPSHADPAYSTPPTTLENDPVYRRYPMDWQVYHTRYVTPEAYWSALRPKVSP